MPIEIASYRFKEQWHFHRCPSCKQIKREPNTVCGLTAGDHIFRCLGCLSGYWRRFGDAFMDAYLDQDEFDRLKAVAPDRVATELDARDQERLQKQIDEAQAKLIEAAIKPKPKVITPEDEKAQALKQEQLYDEADRLSYDEVKAEIEKIEKEEKM